MTDDIEAQPDDNARQARDIALGLERNVNRIVMIVIAIAVSIIALVIVGFLDSHSKSAALNRATERTTHALCTLRGDLARRVQQSEDFLREHPNGLPGISPAVIRNSQKSQEQTVKALGSLRCDG